MAKTDLKTITAYGTEDDKRKLKELAKRDGKTDSKWIVDTIRREHGSGPTPVAPDCVT